MQTLSPEEAKRKDMHSLVGHPGFKHIEAIFIDKIMDLQSIMNLTVTSVEDTVKEISLRKNLIEELKSILAQIKGEANAHEFDDTEVEDKDLYEREE
jgi:hypothetical protein